ncbi:MAG: cysteine desulfurase family protein [Actinomycetota bacterium]
MNTSEIYVDHAATTALRPAAIAALERSFAFTHGNAAGHHGAARRAKNALEEAREQAAELIGAARPHDIVFTSGGTESDNLAVVGSALPSESKVIVVSSVEHKAVLEAARGLSRFGYATRLVPSDGNGVIHPEAVAGVVDGDTAVVSVMSANNETGTVEPIDEIVERVRSVNRTVPIHTDAVQYFVAKPLDVAAIGADLVSLSGHKFGGPTGVGLLSVSSSTHIEPVLVGGSQEAGRRPGTSNVAGIVAMVAAMADVESERRRFAETAGVERDAFERTLMEGDPTVTITAKDTDRLAHFSHVCIPGVLAETLLIRLDAAGVFAAAGSACQSGAVEPSHVLTAMGMPADLAQRCVRFTFGWDTRPGDGANAARRVLETVEALR